MVLNAETRRNPVRDIFVARKHAAGSLFAHEESSAHHIRRLDPETESKLRFCELFADSRPDLWLGDLNTTPGRHQDLCSVSHKKQSHPKAKKD